MTDKFDLVILAADLDAEKALDRLLSRPDRLGINPITFRIFRHPNRDSGCVTGAVEFLRPLISQYHHALVIFDHEGSGQEKKDPKEVESALHQNLERNGWYERAGVVAISPELEIWVWSDSPQVDRCLGWANRKPNLRNALRSHRKLGEDAVKPDDPKDAFEWALRQVRKPLSAAIFQDLAASIPIMHCQDGSFTRFKAILHNWFGNLPTG